jgi:hypothetical protein
MPEDLPRAGGGQGLLKLTKFRGQDHGKSKMSQGDQYERYEFPTGINTLKQVFTPIEMPRQTILQMQ